VSCRRDFVDWGSREDRNRNAREDGDGDIVPGQMERTDLALALALGRPTDVAVPSGLDRDDASKLVEEINLLRNRIAPLRTDLPA
jgi:hypothetical protein